MYIFNVRSKRKYILPCKKRRYKTEDYKNNTNVLQKLYFNLTSLTVKYEIFSCKKDVYSS